MNTEKDFKTLFNELLHNYGLGLSKLADATAIPERFLEAMRAGNDSILPPDPYVRGYLVKIIALTGGNIEELMSAYKRENFKKTSGASDRLPFNRFSLMKLSKGRVALVFIILLIIVYGIIRRDTIIGNPKLVVHLPKETQTYTSINTVLITGEVNTSDKLTINGENVIIQSDGTFSSTWPLTNGLNNIEIKAKRFLGKEVIENKSVIYTPTENNNIFNSSSTVL